jgi:hypothetical protein
VDEVLERAVETTLGDRAVVRDNVASWLRVRLGAPIAFRSKDQMVYGWSLGKTLPFRQDESSIRVLLGGPRTEFFGAFLEFGNLCRSSAAVILNLDDGSPGCDSLK